MVLFVFGIVAGGGISWLIAHWYYKKSTKDLRSDVARISTLLLKLPQDVIDKLSEDERSKLTVAELNELIVAQTRPPEPHGPFDFTGCPRCGSKDLDRSPGVIDDWDSDGFGGVVYQGTEFEQVRCPECGWNDSEFKQMDLP